MDEYGSSFITIEDDEGNEFELEQLDTLEYSAASTVSSSPRICRRTTPITAISSFA